MFDNVLSDEIANRHIDFLSHLQAPGRILSSQVSGSHSYGCAYEGSDVDFKVVYQVPLRSILCLSPAPETFEGKKPDFQAHEIGKFCRLLLKGNPNIVECLFSERWTMRSSVFSGLLQMRQMFLNRTTLRAYLGYGQDQERRYLAGVRLHSTTGKPTAKWAYHMIRLMLDAKKIASEQGLDPFRDIGPERDLLMDIRRGKWDTQEVLAFRQRLKDEVENLKPWALPEGPDEKVMNDWLYDLRMSGELTREE